MSFTTPGNPGGSFGGHREGDVVPPALVSLTSAVFDQSSISTVPSEGRRISVDPSISPLTAQESDATWRPQGTLLTQLNEHSKPISKLVVSYKNLFFATAGDDGFIKFWSPDFVSKREIDRTPHLEHSMDSKVNALALSPCNHIMACASAKGQVQMFDVEEVRESRAQNGTTRQFSGFKKAKQIDVSKSGQVSEMEMASQNLLMFVTHRNELHAWDVRSRSDAFHVPSCPPPHMGSVSKMVTDPHGHWLLLGTTLGHLAIYDLRYQVVSKAWRHPRGCVITSLQHFSHPSMQSDGPLVVIAGMGCEAEQFGVWDISSGVCKSSFQVMDGRSKPVDPMPLVDCEVLISGTSSCWYNDKAFAHLSGSAAGTAKYPHYTRAIYRPADASYVISGGTDRVVRYWDLARVEGSGQIAYPTVDLGFSGLRSSRRPIQYTLEAQGPTFVFREGQTASSPASLQASAVEDDIANAHRGCVTAINSVVASDRSRLLLTAGIDGAVKIFK